MKAALTAVPSSIKIAATMRNILLCIVAIFVLVACGPKVGPPCTSNDGKHTWGKWEITDRKAANGSFIQKRTCTVCGYEEQRPQ